RTLGNCLSIANYARLIAALGASRAKRMLLLAENLSANFHVATVCPFPPPSTETAVLKGSSVHRRLCLADDVCYHPFLRDGHGDGRRTYDAHARTALGGTGAERSEARLLRRWRPALSAGGTGWRKGLDISLRRARPAARHGARRVSRHRPRQSARTGRRLPEPACRRPRPHRGAQREARGGCRRSRKGDDVRRLCNRIHQRPRSGGAKSETSPAVEEQARPLLEPG